MDGFVVLLPRNDEDDDAEALNQFFHMFFNISSHFFSG
jgi:hypothetical protein